MFDVLTALAHPGNNQVKVDCEVPSDLSPVYGYYRDLRVRVQLPSNLSVDRLLLDVRVEDFSLPYTADSVLLTADSELRCNDLIEVEYWQVQVRSGGKPYGVVKYRHLPKPLVLRWDRDYFLHSLQNGTRWFSNSLNQLPTSVFSLPTGSSPISLQEVDDTLLANTNPAPLEHQFRPFVDLRLLGDVLPAVDGFYSYWIALDASVALPVSFFIDIPCNAGYFRTPQYYTSARFDIDEFVVSVPLGRTILTLLDADLNHYATKLVPKSGYGLLPAGELLANMTIGTSESLCYGLLMALAQKDVDAILTQIAGLVRLMLNSDQRGLPNTFYRITLEPIDATVDLYHNAMVGIALAACLRFLQQRPPSELVSLKGWRYQVNYLIFALYDLFNACLEQDDWVGGVYDPVYEVYQERSIAASLAVCLAYVDLLACLYDESAHFRAARLYLTILDAPVSPTDSYYGSFSDSAVGIRNLVLKLVWSQRFGLDTNDLLGELNTVAQQARIAGDEIYNLSVLWAELLVDGLAIAPSAAYTPTFDDWYDQLNYSALINLIKADHEFYGDESFELGALAARAFVTYLIQVADALWPKGVEWPDVALNPSTKLGSFLAAAADVGFEWFLRHQRRRGSLLEGSSEEVARWQALQSFEFEYQPVWYARRWLWAAINTPVDHIEGINRMCQLYGMWIPELEDTTNRPTADVDTTADDVFTVDASEIILLANQYGYVIPPRSVWYQYQELSDAAPRWLKFDPLRFDSLQTDHLYGSKRYYFIKDFTNLNVNIPLKVWKLVPHIYPGFPYSSDASSRLSIDHFLDQRADSFYVIRRANFPIIRVVGYGHPTDVINALVRGNTAGVMLQVYFVEDVKPALVQLQPQIYSQMPVAVSATPAPFVVQASAIGVVNAQATVQLAAQATVEVQSVSMVDVDAQFAFSVAANAVNINQASVSISSDLFAVQATSSDVFIFMIPWFFVR